MTYARNSTRNRSRIINSRARIGRSLRDRLPVELRRRIDRYANSIRPIRYSRNHLNSIMQTADYPRALGVRAAVLHANRGAEYTRYLNRRRRS